MINLIQLELAKKGKRSVMRAFLSAFIVSIACLLLFFFLVFITKHESNSFNIEIVILDQSEADDLRSIISDTPALMSQIISITFMIFSASMYAGYIISEFQSHYIQQMYLYPIPKWKILVSKMIAAGLIGFLGALFTSIIGCILIQLFENNIIFSVPFIFDLIISSILPPILALLPMVIGLWRKSVIWTIVSSVLLSSILQGSFGTFTLSNFPIVNYTVALTAIIFTIIAIKKITQKDCLQ